MELQYKHCKVKNEALWDLFSSKTIEIFLFFTMVDTSHKNNITYGKKTENCTCNKHRT